MKSTDLGILGTKESYREQMKKLKFLWIQPATQILLNYMSGHHGPKDTLNWVITQSNEENATALWFFGHSSFYPCLWTWRVIKHVRAIAALFAEGQFTPTIKGMVKANDSTVAAAPDRAIDLFLRWPSPRHVLFVEQNPRAPNSK